MSSSFGKLVCAVVLLKSSVRIAAARVRPGHPPEWKLCLEVAVPAPIDPLTMIQQLFAALGEVHTILVHQAEARSSLLRLYAHDVVVLVDRPSAPNRASSAPPDRKSVLAVYWPLAGMVHTYTRRSAPDGEAEGAPTSGLFNKYRYRPAQR